MSRSYRKTPINKERNNSVTKKLANKRVRSKDNTIRNGNNYKKAFSSYKICDFKLNVEMTFEEWLESRNNNKDLNERERKDLYREYRKTFINK